MTIKVFQRTLNVIKLLEAKIFGTPSLVFKVRSREPEIDFVPICQALKLLPGLRFKPFCY
jgi:hypothetical protein